MTQEEKVNLYLCLTCGIGQLGSKLNQALSVGKCADKYVENILIAGYLNQALCRVESSCITNYSYNVSLTFVDPEVTLLYDVIITLIVDNITLATYQGDPNDLDTDLVLASFLSQINANSTTTSYYASITDSVLTVWTCETPANPGLPLVTDIFEVEGDGDVSILEVVTSVNEGDIIESTTNTLTSVDT